MKSSRGYAFAVIGLIVLGGFAWYATGQAWDTVTVEETAKVPGNTFNVSGRDAAAPLAGLALVVGAAGLGVVASSGTVRRAVAALAVLAALGGAVWSLALDLGAVTDQLAAESPAFIPGNDLIHELRPWRYITTLAFLGAGVLGAFVFVRAERWPSMSARYDRPAGEAPVSDHPQDLWKALDDGRDPTQ